MIARAFEGDVIVRQSAKRISKRGAIRIANGDVVQTRGAWRRRTTAGALPCVQANVVVVATGAEECRTGLARDHVEAQHPAVERDRTIEIRDLEVDVADVNSRIDALAHTSMIPQAGPMSHADEPQPCAGDDLAAVADARHTRSVRRL